MHNVNLIRDKLGCKDHSEPDAPCTDQEMSMLSKLARYEVGFLCDNGMSMLQEAAGHGGRSRWDVMVDILLDVIWIATSYDLNGVDLFFLDPRRENGPEQPWELRTWRRTRNRDKLLAFLARDMVDGACREGELDAVRSDGGDKAVVVCRRGRGGQTEELRCDTCHSLRKVLTEERNPRKHASTVSALTGELRKLPESMRMELEKQRQSFDESSGTSEESSETGEDEQSVAEILLIMFTDGRPKQKHGDTNTGWVEVFDDLVDLGGAHLEVVVIPPSEESDEFREGLARADGRYDILDFTLDYSLEKQKVDKAGRLSPMEFSHARWKMKMLLAPIERYFDEMNAPAGCPTWVVWLLIGVAFLCIYISAWVVDCRRDAAAGRLVEELVEEPPEVEMVTAAHKKWMAAT